ncbi:hypothetical protein PAEPH01_0053 [Pancytospora epiphaga]|nr:hypothetical protein PAEPH01_0053 [Pancytospora epiphaga]
MTAPALVKTTNKNESEDHSTAEMDPKHFDMICNPAYHAFKDGLAAFHENPSNEIIDQLHLILLLDNSQQHTQIQLLIPQLYPYITREDLYDKLILVFSDIAHLNKAICTSMLSFGIFDKLDFSKEVSFGLVLNICDANVEAWAVFCDKHMGNGEIASHPKIQLLVSQFQ